MAAANESERDFWVGSADYRPGFYLPGTERSAECDQQLMSRISAFFLADAVSKLMAGRLAVGGRLLASKQGVPDNSVYVWQRE